MNAPSRFNSVKKLQAETMKDLTWEPHVIISLNC